jgi:uncharacterized protein DUF2171
MLTKIDLKSRGQHHIIRLDWVEKIDDKVRLKKAGKRRHDAMADGRLIPVATRSPRVSSGLKRAGERHPAALS